VSIYNSLKLMEEYRENPQHALDKCRNLVTRYMSKDEHDRLKDDKHTVSFSISQGDRLEMDSGLKRVRKPIFKQARMCIYFSGGFRGNDFV